MLGTATSQFVTTGGSNLRITPTKAKRPAEWNYMKDLNAAAIFDYLVLPNHPATLLHDKRPTCLSF